MPDPFYNEILQHLYIDREKEEEYATDTWT